MNQFERTEPPHEADERATLTGFLQYQRETLAWKCSGLSAEQLRRTAVAPSELSLLGLIRHMAEAEQGWFQDAMRGETPAPIWPAADGNVDFDVADADPDRAFAVWHGACARSDEIIAETSLDAVGRHRAFSLRWVLTHMIEEYARHNGHADLIRERIDGATGE